MTKVKATYTKAQSRQAEEKDIPVDPWGVLKLFEGLMAEADEIVKKYKKEG